MSLRKIDESNVDVEPYAFALNNASLIREIIRDHFRPRSNFEWEKFFFSNFPFFLSMTANHGILPFESINQAAISPRKRNVEGRGEHPSSNSLVGGRAEERWAVVPSI